MKAAIFNPYLDTLGGGERYTFSFVKVLLNLGWEVDIEWQNEDLKKKVKERFGIDILKSKFVKNIQKGKDYDLCFWVSDGSIPLLSSRKNILHFQIPFLNPEGKSLINKMKFFRINKIICNSMFTKEIIDREYGVTSNVIYPPVSVEEIKSKRKENVILYVGRFSNLTQAKRHDILIKTFKKLVSEEKFKSWQLILAGGVEVGVGNYLKKLKGMSTGFNIRLIESPNYREIKDLYSRAAIFWSAAGYGVNEKKEPQKVEHFGITAVEAMAGGCVPVVFAAGGAKEIVTPDSGFLWQKESELITVTKRLISDRKLFRTFSSSAKNSCQKFGYERFNKEVISLL